MSLHSNHSISLQLALFVPIATRIGERLGASNPQVLALVIFFDLDSLTERYSIMVLYFESNGKTNYAL